MSIGAHQTRTEASKDEWLTPPEITKLLGPFDLDPCSPINRPWSTANEHLTIKDDGLWGTWDSWKFVWMNPPYGTHTADWMEKLANHGNGIALIFARTETKMFFDYVWNRADYIFFFKGRLTFHHVDGTPGDYTGGAPSVLVGYGKKAVQRIRRMDFQRKIPGELIQLKSK